MDYSALTGFLNSLESYSQDLVQELRGGAKLCHYTTLDGALGIIQGGDLWLSHLRFSNDDGEFTYGLDLVTKELEDLATASAVPSTDSRVPAARSCAGWWPCRRRARAASGRTANPHRCTAGSPDGRTRC